MKYTVLGAGAMGSTVASRLLANGHEVCLWFTEKDEWLLTKVTATKKHPLSGAELHGACVFTATELAKAIADAEALVFACSSDGLLAVMDQVDRAESERRLPAVVVTKGFIEAEGTVTTISQVMRHAEFALLGGPMIAGEIAAGQPAGGVVASASPRALSAGLALSSPTLSLLGTGDVRGVELCAALKNVYAILVGVAEPRGANLRSLAFARCLEELSSVVVKSGGLAETVLGPAGAGDLYVTSISGRNGEFGRRVGGGEEPLVAHREMEAAGKTVEGVRASSLGARYVIDEHHVDAPLLRSVAKLCAGEITPADLVALLLR